MQVPEQGPAKRELVQWLQLSALPTLQFWRGGEMLWEHQGNPGLERALGEGACTQDRHPTTPSEPNLGVSSSHSSHEEEFLVASSRAPGAGILFYTGLGARGTEASQHVQQLSSAQQVADFTTSSSFPPQEAASPAAGGAADLPSEIRVRRPVQPQPFSVCPAPRARPPPPASACVFMALCW